MTDRCPLCDADLRGEPIPEEHFVHDRDSEAHQRSVETHERFSLSGECVCLPYGDLAPEERFFQRTISVEISGVYDGGLFYRCPDCGGAWHRWPEGGPLHEIAERYVRRINADAAA